MVRRAVVPAYHYSVLDGLPVKTDRHVNVKSPSPIGAVAYTENGTYTLTSLTPQR